MTTISPLTRAVIEKNKLNNNQTQTQVQAQTPAPEIKSDTVELSTKNKTGLIDKIKANKKIIIPAAIGLAAIAGGLIFAIKTGKISFKGKIEQQAAEILGESKKIQKTAEEIKVEAQKQYDEVMEILKKAKEEGFKDVIDESGKTIRRFVDDTSTEGAEKIMDELDGDKILRRTSFNPDNLEISRIYKGITQNANKIESEAESFNYSNGKLLRFTKDYKWNPDGTEGWAEDFTYSDGKLSQFVKDYKWNPDKTEGYAEGFTYSDGELSGFIKDYKSNPDGTKSWGEDFLYSDDKLSGFIKDCKSNPDGTESWGENFVRNAKGKIEKVDPQAI